MMFSFIFQQIQGRGFTRQQRKFGADQVCDLSSVVIGANSNMIGYDCPSRRPILCHCEEVSIRIV